MTPILYRCPNTGRRVQAVFPAKLTENGDETFMSVTCPACGQGHLVKPKTGKTLGSDEK